MPLYEYQCSQCGTEFEKVVRFSEADNIPACPICDSPETRKKLSVFATHGVSLGGGSASSTSNCIPRGGFS